MKIFGHTFWWAWNSDSCRFRSPFWQSGSDLCCFWCYGCHPSDNVKKKQFTGLFRCNRDILQKISHLRKCERQTLYMWWQNKTLSNAARVQAVTGINSGTNCAKERSKCFPNRTVKMKHRWNIWGSCVYLFCHCTVTETVRVSLWDSLRSVSSTSSVTVAYCSWKLSENERFLKCFPLMEKYCYTLTLKFHFIHFQTNL